MATGSRLRKLVDQCSLAFDTFKPRRTTVDAHIDEFIQRENVSDQGDALFIKQVVYGCVRYKKMLKVFLNALYFKHSSEVSREDYNMYMIYCYLAAIRLDDLGTSVLIKFLNAQDPTKMNVFLQFLFNEQSLNRWLKDEWCKLFDENYVDDTLIGRLLANKVSIQGTIDRIQAAAEKGVVLEQTADDASSGANSTGGGGKTTIPKPFNITKARPRILPEPDRIEVGFKANEVPQSTFQRPTIEQKVADAREEAQKNTRLRHESYESFEFTERPMHLDRLKQEAAQKFEEDNRYIAPTVNPVPKRNPETQPKVRMTAAAVLREDALLKKKQKKEAEMIRKYESELRDAKSFEEWKVEQELKEEEERLALVEQRRAEMIMTDIAAREAREKLVLNKKMIVNEARKEANAMRKQLSLEDKRKLAEKQALVEEVKEAETKVGRGKEELAEQRAIEAAKLREEKKAQLAAVKAEQEKEWQEKMDIVRQIKALESVKPKRDTTFDPTESSGVGLLDEMPLAELKERLAMAKEAAQQEEEEKRARIILAKQEKEAQLLAKAEAISRVRAQAGEEAVDRRHALKAKREIAEQIRAKKREEQMLHVQKTIEKKRKELIAEEERLAEERRQIEIQKQFLAAGAAQVEEKKWAELERGAERKLREQIKVFKDDNRAAHISKHVDVSNRIHHRKVTHAERKQFAKDYANRVATKRAEHQESVAEDRAYKESMYRTGKSREAKLLESQKAAKPYATELSKQSMTGKMDLDTLKQLGTKPKSPSQHDYFDFKL